MRSVARAHRGLVVLLVVGLVARIICAAAYWPALFYSDSWAYVRHAYGGSPVAFAPDRPSGYPLLIRFLTLPARHVAIVVTTQHVAGLFIGAVVYTLVLRAGARRWLALAAAAVALVDGDLILLEQYLMPETFAALCLVLSAWFALTPVGRRAPHHLAASAALLGAAGTIRAAALFAIPIWLVFVVRARLPSRALALAGASLLAPLLAYAALQSVAGYGSALHTSDGWFLYGRVAGFANCADPHIPAEARSLCPVGVERGWYPSHYIWGRSVVTRRFPGGPSARNDRASALLERFAFAVIRDQPLTYAWTVSKDVGRLFLTDGGTQAADLLRSPPDHDRIAATLFRIYRYVTVPGWLTMLLLVASVAAIVLRIVRRDPTRQRQTWAIVLLSGSALAVTAGAVATVDADYRYLLVALPLLACGGALAGDDLLSGPPGADQAPA